MSEKRFMREMQLEGKKAQARKSAKDVNDKKSAEELKKLRSAVKARRKKVRVGRFGKYSDLIEKKYKFDL